MFLPSPNQRGTAATKKPRVSGWQAPAATERNQQEHDTKSNRPSQPRITGRGKWSQKLSPATTFKLCPTATREGADQGADRHPARAVHFSLLPSG